MKKALRVVGIIIVFIVLAAAIITSTSMKPSNAEKVWDQDMIIGNLEAKNYFIVYSDLVCPYCLAFEDAIIKHEEEFKQYLEENDILYEVRLSDYLYEYGEAQAISSRHAAMAAYCAKREGKFWDYYNKAVSDVWNNHFKPYGKSAFSAINSYGSKYWIDLGEQIGLGESFVDCVNNKEPLEEIEANAAKMAKLAKGMPSFKFNSFTPSGFDTSWGWEEVLSYFEEGLKH